MTTPSGLSSLWLTGDAVRACEFNIGGRFDRIWNHREDKPLSVLGDYFSVDLTEEGRSTLREGSSVPCARFPDWVDRRRGATHLRSSSCLHAFLRVVGSLSSSATHPHKPFLPFPLSEKQEKEPESRLGSRRHLYSCWEMLRVSPFLSLLCQGPTLSGAV